MLAYVLDDEPVLCKALCMQLKRWGIEAKSALTIEQLLGLDPPPDLLIIDYNLGGTDAVACAPLLEAAWPNTPRIILTATLLSEEDEAKVKAARYLAVLQKPLRGREIPSVFAVFCAPK
ncbi:MAG: response regulator [Myxococcaceae bacterium]